MMTINIQPVDVRQILADPSTHFAVKRVFAEWLGRDPLENVHDAELLLRMFVTKLSELQPHILQ